MPIVFVHGVANRKGPEYDKGEKARNEFLREIVLPKLATKPNKVAIVPVYWGDKGVAFRWNQASLPDPEKKYETFGGTLDDASLQLLREIPELANHGKKTIVQIAQSSMPEAVDLLWAAALLKAESKALPGLAKSFCKAYAYAKANANPSWLAMATAGNFADKLAEAAGLTVDGQETFGGGFLQSLSETASRVSNLLGKVSGDVATNLFRNTAHLGASVFMGDVFQYLLRRKNADGSTGPIPTIVISAFRQALGLKSTDDPKVIVIGHSLGGVITYDVLTHFAPDIKIDEFISVGSQVALFEEMSMYAKDATPATVQLPAKLPKPDNIGVWRNVFDLNDAFSFSAAAIFDNVSDFYYDTGYGVASAHSGYFKRPSFYVRLAERIAAP